MAGIAEPETAVESIDATVNYFLDTGEKPFTYTGGPGSLDVRTGGGQDPHRVVIRNGRPGAENFALAQAIAEEFVRALPDVASSTASAEGVQDVLFVSTVQIGQMLVSAALRLRFRKRRSAETAGRSATSKPYKIGLFSGTKTCWPPVATTGSAAIAP